MQLNVTLDGVTHTVNPKPGDLVRFEREFKVSAASLGENVMLEHIFYIAWAALRREGVFTDDFEAFLDLADMEGEEEAPLPPPAS
jgi:hypothetical protein